MDPEARVLDLFLELVVGLLGLAHPGRDAAALVERHVQAPQYRGGVLLLKLGIAGHVGSIQKAAPLLILRLERDHGQQLAHDLLDGIERGLLGIDGGEDDRVLAIAERHGFVEGPTAADGGSRGA